MKKPASGQVLTPYRVRPRMPKRGKQALLLPIPETVRQRRKIELWRDRLWKSRNKYLMVLSPQDRELIRKTTYSMGKAGLPEMIILLRTGLVSLWFFTGSLQKMREFIESVVNGKVYLMSTAHLPHDTPADLPKDELLRRLLLYNPSCRPDGCSLETVAQAIRFFSLIGTPPEVKLWIEQWVLEVEETRGQAVDETGKELADALWADVTGTKNSDKADNASDEGDQTHQQQFFYW